MINYKTLPVQTIQWDGTPPCMTTIHWAIKGWASFTDYRGGTLSYCCQDEQVPVGYWFVICIEPGLESVHTLSPEQYRDRFLMRGSS